MCGSANAPPPLCFVRRGSPGPCFLVLPVSGKEQWSAGRRQGAGAHRPPLAGIDAPRRAPLSRARGLWRSPAPPRRSIGPARRKARGTVVCLRDFPRNQPRKRHATSPPQPTSGPPVSSRRVMTAAREGAGTRYDYHPIGNKSTFSIAVPGRAFRARTRNGQPSPRRRGGVAHCRDSAGRRRRDECGAGNNNLIPHFARGQSALS